MEELLELRQKLLLGDLDGALVIVDELEEMSRDDKINNIRSYAIILLKHLIKQNAEKRTTKSWDISIRNSVEEIKLRNKRRKSGGYYLGTEDLYEMIKSAYNAAINSASLEVEEGRYDSLELKEIVDKDAVLSVAMELLRC